MPELPEVETVKRVLLPIVKERTITKIDVLRKSVVNNKESDFISYYTNEKFLDITRIGKFLIFHFNVFFQVFLPFWHICFIKKFF